VWGIAVDDSSMQRKILHKLFTHCGIPDDHILVMGGTVSQGHNHLNFISASCSDVFHRLFDRLKSA
jgi:hypothetical protein